MIKIELNTHTIKQFIYVKYQMDTLCKDIILLLCTYLNDTTKVYFLSTTKTLCKFKLLTKYNQVHILTKKISKLSYFKNFTDIIKMDTVDDLKKISSTSISRLTFDDNFNYPIKNLISQVTHLTFGHNYNQKFYSVKTELSKCGNFIGQGILNRIPHSVTHLTFGCEFNQVIKNDISASVTHLIFGHNFNQKINYEMCSNGFVYGPYNSIPDSVTHLTFGHNFNQSLESVPKYVTNLTLVITMQNQEIMRTIPSTVIDLILVSLCQLSVIKNIIYDKLVIGVNKFINNISYAEYDCAYTKSYSKKSLIKIK